ncbi:sigma-54 interaction domain-containing protein [Oleidesulfovibrio sp.]|uniref:sigma-54 interaction domain-containing protein n=1 Tax=Oleidesulfovibrio sp. TaxID=2909707 RepID=UPI003A844EFA
MVGYVVVSGDDWKIERVNLQRYVTVDFRKLLEREESFLNCLCEQGVRRAVQSVEEMRMVTVRFKDTSCYTMRWVWGDDSLQKRVVLLAEDGGDVEDLGMCSHELETLLDSLYDGIWVIDRHGITVRVNKAMERIAGIKASDVTGMHVLSAVELGYTETAVTLKAMEAKQPVTMFDVYRSGIRCLNTSTPIYNQAGEVWGVIACIRDMTEIEELQKKLLRYEWEARAYNERVGKDDYFTFEVPSSDLTGVQRELAKAASVNHPVLLLGETGTGKTFAASRIHELSYRQSKPFVPVNCGAIPPDLLEAELFGYEGGAFTGAKQAGKLGVVDLAEGGTVFLDEVAELPLAMQVKLLHLLDGSGYRRVGGRQQIIPDIRVIAATNHSLDSLLHSGKFRRDLYYRLCGLVVTLPALRGNPQQIKIWVDFFLKRIQRDAGKKRLLSPAVLEALCEHSWPGNLRELKTCIELMFELSETEVVGLDCLPESISSTGKRQREHRPVRLNDAVESLEKELILASLERTGSTYKTAKELGVSQATVARKAKRYRAHKDYIEHEPLY